MDRKRTIEHDEHTPKKQKRVPMAKYWVFTWHGGTDGMGFDEDSDEWQTVCRYMGMYSSHCSMQEEKAPTTGRHHIQGFVAFKERKRFPEIKDLQLISWSKKCLASEKSNKAYTSKSDTAVPGGLLYRKGFTVLKSILSYGELRPWQKEIWDMVKEECTDDRSIYWYYDEHGGAGKSRLIKSLIYHMNAFLFEGKTSDIANRLVQAREAPKICLMNLRRTQETHVNYNAIEALKDGLVATGKYEGGQKIFDPPHVLVFANFLPDFKSLSIDRFRCYDFIEGGFTPYSADGAIAPGLVFNFE